MKTDILNREDIERIVGNFYDVVAQDTTIGHFFHYMNKKDWEKHRKLMCDFWENILFYSGEYEGNPIETHRRINEITPTTIVHFERWEDLFVKVVDSLYQGHNADKMKQHSKAIAGIMKQNIKR